MMGGITEDPSNRRQQQAPCACILDPCHAIVSFSDEAREVSESSAY
jgi:hypothetical protein